MALAAPIAFMALLFFVYVGLTKSSDFKKLPEEKQLAGKKRLKTALIIGAVIGFYQIFAGFTNA